MVTRPRGGGHGDGQIFRMQATCSKNNHKCGRCWFLAHMELISSDLGGRSYDHQQQHQHQHRANLKDQHGQWEANIEDQQVGSWEEQALVNALAPTDNIVRERWLGPMHN